MFERTKVFLYRFFFSSWAGLTLGHWITLLALSHFRISLRYLPRALFITLCAPLNSLQNCFEQILYAKKVSATPIPPPLFILGHWRGGTTYLHQLLRLDHRFVTPSMVEVLFPVGMLTGGPMGFFMKLFLPKDRVVDGVKLGIDEPFEDEFALALLSLRSPYLGWAFPRDRAWHEKNLLLDQPDDLQRWQSALLGWLRKITYKHRRPAILKSPPHTARVRHLIALFPQARFIHIHRDPVEVFSSTCRLLQQGIDGLRLQHLPTNDPDYLAIEDEVIARYQTLYTRYLADREMLPAHQLIEIRYDDLRADPVATLEQIYTHLALPTFDDVRPSIEQHRQADVGYVVRTSRALPPEKKQKLRVAWQKIYTALGYDIVD